jgi:hypothetical protein
MVELMIASMVFAVLLLVVTAGVMSFSRQYYKGIVTTKTQTAARNIMSEVAQSIQFGSNVYTDLVDPSGLAGMCVDNKLFSYMIGQQVKDRGGVAAQHQAYHGMVVDTTGSACADTTLPSTLPTNAGLATGQRELLGDNMRLGALDITNDGSTYIIHVRVIYGDDDLLSPAVSSSTTADEWGATVCGAASRDSQYCAVSDLTTTVQKRL